MTTKNLLPEFLGDFSMSSTRRMDAPGNIRYRQNVRGSRTPHLDVSSEERTNKQTAVVYLRKGDKVLAVSRGSDLSDMNMPGGGVEPGEDPMTAAARELWEETGLIAHELVHVYTKEVNGRTIVAFKAISFAGKLRSSPEGKAAWVDPQTIRSSRYGDFFKEMLDKLAGDFL